MQPYGRISFADGDGKIGSANLAGRRRPHADGSDMSTDDDSASTPDRASESDDERPWDRWGSFVDELGSPGGDYTNSCPTTTTSRSSPQMPLDISDSPVAHREKDRHGYLS